MDAKVRDFLDSGGITDITTIGRSTGEPRRIEIRIHNIDGEIYITGFPGKRSWYANMLSNSHFIIHVKGGPGSTGLEADVEGVASDVSAMDRRSDIIPKMVAKANLPGDIGERIRSSVLVHVELSGI